MKKYILIISMVLLSLTMLFGDSTAKENISIEEAFSRGLNYFNGNTVEIDYREAAEWFYLGAEYWDEDSMLYYALSLLNLSENMYKEEAFYWMSLALYFEAEEADTFWGTLIYMMPFDVANSILQEVNEDLMEEGFEKGNWESWL